MSDIESAVRSHFARVMPEYTEVELDLELDIVADYGLTSMNKVLFLIGLCDELDVSLATFTEGDLAELQTLQQVIAAMSARQTSSTSVA